MPRVPDPEQGEVKEDAGSQQPCGTQRKEPEGEPSTANGERTLKRFRCSEWEDEEEVMVQEEEKGGSERTSPGSLADAGATVSTEDDRVVGVETNEAGQRLEATQGPAESLELPKAIQVLLGGGSGGG